MASNILIKRSTGSTAPGSITYGELAVTTGANGTQANAGDRVFVGDNNGAAQVVGGRYFTDLLDHVHGTITASSAVLLDSNLKVDNWNVDDINLNANVITTSTTDSDLVFRANGTGKLVIEDGQELEFGTTGDVEFVFNDSDAVVDIKRVAGTPDLRIADDMKLHFGNTKDASIYYDETTSDKIQVEGADWNYAVGVTASYADTTDASNVATASVTFAGGIGISATTWTKDLKVDDNTTLGTANTDILTVNATTTFQNGVTFNGQTNISGSTQQTGDIQIDNLKLDGNTLSTINSIQELIIDPFPAGGDADGLVIIKGDLQIDGTTTTVNSASMSVNDPTIELADPTTPVTVKTLATFAGNATVDVILDTVEQLQVGNSITGTGIPGGTTISAINTGTKTITLSAAITADQVVGATLVSVRGADDAMDRGVKIHYNASGTNKFGFFGYDRTGGNDGAGAWTFIEDATDTGTVFGVTGNRGTVVLGDLELDTDLAVQYGGSGASSFNTNGIIYGNGTGALQVTEAANMASPGTTPDMAESYQILTVTSGGVPVWTNTIDGGTF
nr:hypothetical protein [uncultured Mediterranean phage uvMED]BAR31210.1 hypothetical protein [uncultured Mediterranean phage uvMED]BAR31237.1 hypothetical protein [uncultured Mediterranean phage uvMED]|tara:strand:+ start:26753 stop:28438 length:1686 start_codon:yes stop_codon:yes gene_type:complete